MVVLTWRSNELHRELAPADPGTPNRQESTWAAATETDRSGYRFYSDAGRRYVNAWQADCPDQPGVCTVKVVRSVWRDGAWRKAAVLPTTKIDSKEIWNRSPLGALKVHR